MAQAAIARPFHECDLRDELGLDPGRGPRNALLGFERGRVAHEREQPVGEVPERRAGEPRSDLAGVAQGIALEVADEQGAELGARTARRGEAADHEFLRARALELEPVARARRHVRRAGALGDQALPAVLTRAREQRRTVAGHRLGQAKRVRPPQHPLEHVPPLLEGQRPDVAAAGDQHVERVVEELAAGAAAEPVATPDERHGLPVDHEAVGRIRVQRGGQRCVAIVERQLVPRVQPGRPAILDGQAADAVELALEHPPGTRRAVRGEHGLHRDHERRSHDGTRKRARRPAVLRTSADRRRLSGAR